jgi:putative ABC transport system substrate-binding protein
MTRDPMASICSPEMPRRAFMAVIAGGLLAAPLAAEGQQPSKVPQIGYLSYGSAAESATRVRALRIGLRDHGYVEGQSINLVFRELFGHNLRQ